MRADHGEERGEAGGGAPAQRDVARMAKAIEAIAKQHLGVETLAVRGLRRCDFHEVGVDSLRDALEAAYRAGAAATCE